MNEERNGQAPNDEPQTATPDIVEKGEDTEGKEPPAATQAIIQEAEGPPELTQDIMMKYLTQVNLKEFTKEAKKEE